MKNFKKFALIIILLVVLAVNTSEAAKNSQAKNITDLFTRVNPALNEKRAERFAKIVIEAAKKFNQDPYIIAAIIVHESTVNANAVSKGGDYGLMQIHWKAHYKTLQKRFKIKSSKGLFDARINIFFGTEIFADCMKKSSTDEWGALMRYSSGSRKLATKVLATVQELRKKK